MEKTIMTKDGYDEQLKVLEKLERSFAENEKRMTESYHNSAGDGAHDNAEFEELLARERMLANQIIKQKERINSIKIIEVEELDEDMVNIGDTLNLELIYAEDDKETITLTLVGADGNMNENKISVNSPLGNSLYKKKIGELTSYNVNTNEILVRILEKVNLKEENGKRPQKRN